MPPQCPFVVFRFLNLRYSRADGIAPRSCCPRRDGKVAPDGEVCKGTDFPGLLRAIERPPPRRADRATPQADKDTTVSAAATLSAETNSHEERPSVKVGDTEQRGETVVTDRGDGEETKEGKEGKDGGAEGKASTEEEDEEAKKQKEQEEAKVLVKSGTLKLLPVLGEETTAKVGGVMSGTLYVS